MGRPRIVSQTSSTQRYAADLRAEAGRLQQEAKMLLQAADLLDKKAGPYIVKEEKAA